MHGLPNQKLSVIWSLGRQVGIVETILRMYKMPYTEVTPQTWQKGIFYKTDGKDTKEKSLNVAKRLFPDHTDFFKRKKDHGRSDALLLARYSQKNII